MSLPFDLEDIVGVALADVLRRTGLFLGSIALASVLAALALAVGELGAYGSFDLRLFGDAMPRALWLFLAPLTSGWAVLHVPTVIAAGFYFAKAEAPGARAFVIAVFTLGLWIILSAPWPDWFAPSFFGIALGGGVADPDRASIIWRGVGLFIFSGCCGGLFWLAWLLTMKSRAAAEQHLVALSIENRSRRQALREIHGTDIPELELPEEEDRGS